MIGSAIKKIREKRGYSQGEFIKKVGINQGYFSMIENNKTEPSIPKLKKIASELEVPLGVLFMMGLEKKDFSDDKKQQFDIIMPTITDLIMSLL